ncbi:MAG TPA: phospholipase D-like domain-containing protein [Pseudogracilibacillus sp.]|nr:phospholipase D-like domain-containing protein [Pseudogracilibacillus sp.]
MKKYLIWIICALVSLSILTVGLINHFKKLPTNISYEGDIHKTDDLQFLYDLTYKDKDDETQVEQSIFSEVWKLIDEADDFILIDMFLFNDYTDQSRDFPNLSGELTERLIEKRKAHPHMPIVFITDPINTGYNSYESEQIKLLKDHDIEVVITDLDKLHDSNKLYTSMWRIIAQPLGYGKRGWLPNPLASEGPPLTLRSYLAVFNVKANHRKAFVSEKNAIIQSANAHDESGFASNIAFKLSGSIIRDIVEAEQAVIDYSGGKTKINPVIEDNSSGDITAQYLTEGKILQSLVAAIDEADQGDTIWSGMFYIANRSIIEALHAANERGVNVHIILDKNQVAFGNQKTGLPNVPTANELNGLDHVTIRWYESEEDQYHSKLLLVQKEKENIIIGGSANYTTRSLDDLNLENNVKIVAPNHSTISNDVEQYFTRLWFNEDGVFTSEYETNEGALTPLLKVTYWLQKVTGFTTY